jgi:hypothetical protein
VVLNACKAYVEQLERYGMKNSRGGDGINNLHWQPELGGGANKPGSDVLKTAGAVKV